MGKKADGILCHFSVIWLRKDTVYFCSHLGALRYILVMSAPVLWSPGFQSSYLIVPILHHTLVARKQAEPLAL